MKNDLIYVFGHKNPDTDSVCAAICMSYLKNKLGLNTVPAVLGNINLETKYALDHFGFKEPMHLNDVKIQIKDVNYHKNSYIDKNSTIKDAYDYMSKYKMTGLCVVENKNKYFGYISLREIAYEIINGDFHRIDTSYGNIMSTLKGKSILRFDKEISGKVLVTTYKKNKLEKDSIVICDDDEDIVEYAVDSCVKLIILVCNQELNKTILDKAKKNKVNIIKTSYNSYEVSKLITLCNYIRNYVRCESDFVTFNEIDYLSDFLDKSKLLKHNNYPILNGKKECCGLLTLTDTNNVNRKKVILVDHNNFSQSVDGLEEADIVEVIDHHNIGDIVTKRPINFRNTSCGCVSTIIYEMFNENIIRIPSNIAGLMLSAILSDTLLLTSPTTTPRDVKAVEALAKIAKVDYKTYGTKLLKYGMSIKGLKNEELLHKDFKTYKVDDNLIGIGQLLTSDYKSIKPKFNELSKFLDEEAKRGNYKVLALFVTDIFEHKSYCLFNKSASEIIKNAFNLNSINEGVMLDGILSRKIQIAPYIMEALSK